VNRRERGKVGATLPSSRVTKRRSTGAVMHAKHAGSAPKAVTVKIRVDLGRLVAALPPDRRACVYRGTHTGQISKDLNLIGKIARSSQQRDKSTRPEDSAIAASFFTARRRREPEVKSPARTFASRNEAARRSRRRRVGEHSPGRRRLFRAKVKSPGVSVRCFFQVPPNVGVHLHLLSPATFGVAFISGAIGLGTAFILGGLLRGVFTVSLQLSRAALTLSSLRVAGLDELLELGGEDSLTLVGIVL